MSEVPMYLDRQRLVDALFGRRVQSQPNAMGRVV